jgi:hypothetical protein
VRFEAVEPGDGVAEAADIGGQRRRTADMGQQEVGGGVVADRQDGLAEGADRQGTVREVGGGDRRDREEVGGAVAQSARQAVASGVHVGQDARGEHALAGAANAEALVGPVRQAAAGAGIADMHAEPAAGLPFDRGDRIGRRMGWPGASGEQSAGGGERDAAGDGQGHSGSAPLSACNLSPSRRLSQANQGDRSWTRTSATNFGR